MEARVREPQVVLCLHAASGAGKSSLLLAGFAPRLRTCGWPVHVDRHPGEPGLARRIVASLFELPDDMALGDDQEDLFVEFARGMLDVDKRILELRRFILQRTELYRSGDETALELTGDRHDLIERSAPALLVDDDRRKWWAAARERRREDRRRTAGWIAAASAAVLVIAAIGWWAYSERQTAVARATLGGDLYAVAAISRLQLQAFDSLLHRFPDDRVWTWQSLDPARVNPAIFAGPVENENAPDLSPDRVPWASRTTVFPRRQRC